MKIIDSNINENWENIKTIIKKTIATRKGLKHRNIR